MASFRDSSPVLAVRVFLGERTTDTILADPTACPCQSNSASDSSVIPLPSAHSVHGFGRPAPFCCNLCGTPVHHEQHVVGPSVLHVRLLILMLRHYDHHLCRGDCSPGLLPTLQRELPLAMESVHSSGGLGCLCVCICTHLLDYSDQL